MADMQKTEKKKTVRVKKPVVETVPVHATDSVQATQSQTITKTKTSRLRKDYLIQARWSHATFLRQVIDSIKDLVSETNMDWDDSGIRIQGMDAAHIALSNILLTASDCECYHVQESITVGLDVLRISKILAMANTEDTCELFIKSDQDATLSILLESPDSSKKALFEIPLLEIDMEFMDIPDTTYDHEIQITSSEIPSAIREMSFLGDVVQFAIQDDEFQININGQNGKGQRSWKGDLVKIRSSTDKFSQPFPIKYMLLALKATTTTQTLVLEMSDNLPLRISCLFGKGSSIVNFVAPKIVDDEN